MSMNYTSVPDDCALENNPVAQYRRQHDVEERLIVDTFRGVSLTSFGEPEFYWQQRWEHLQCY